MSARTLAEVDADIARCQWLRTHMRDLGDVMAQDRALARLNEERNQLLAKAVAS